MNSLLSPIHSSSLALLQTHSVLPHTRYKTHYTRWFALLVSLSSPSSPVVSLLFLFILVSRLTLPFVL